MSSTDAEFRMIRFESKADLQALWDHRRDCVHCRLATRVTNACLRARTLHEAIVRTAHENARHHTLGEDRGPGFLQRERDAVLGVLGREPRHWWETLDLSKVGDRHIADFLEEGNLERLRLRDALAVQQIQGIDTSQWQGQFPWGEAVNAGIGFGISKASEGNGYTDPRWGWNVSQLLAPGPIVGGSYHFMREDLGNRPVDEAGWYLSRHPAQCFSLTTPWIWALDAESAGGSANGCYSFLDTVSNRVGYSSWFYSFDNWIRTRGVKAFNRPLWLAWPNASAPPTEGWPVITTQQYGTRPFSVGAVDANVFFGDVQTLLRLAGAEGGIVVGAGISQTASAGDLVEIFHLMQSDIFGVIDPTGQEAFVNTVRGGVPLNAIGDGWRAMPQAIAYQTAKAGLIATEGDVAHLKEAADPAAFAQLQADIQKVLVDLLPKTGAP